MKKEVVLFKERSEVFHREFEKLGFDVIRFVPVLRFEYESFLKSVKKKLLSSDYDGIVFTSPRAAKALEMIMSSIEDEKDRKRIEMIWKTKPVFVVGTKTMEEVKRVWVSKTKPDLRGHRSGSARKLCEDSLLPFLRENPKSKLLFLCGRNRRPTVLDMCGENRIEECVSYESIGTSIHLDKLARERSSLDASRWFVFFSPRGVSIVRHHREVCVNKIKGAYLASIGPTTKKAIESVSGWSCSATPCKPKAESLARAIKSKIIYFNRQQFRRTALGFPLVIAILPMLAWIVYKLGSK